MRKITKKSLDELAKIMPALSVQEQRTFIGGTAGVPQGYSEEFLAYLANGQGGLVPTGSIAKYFASYGADSLDLYLNVGSGTLHIDYCNYANLGYGYGVSTKYSRVVPGTNSKGEAILTYYFDAVALPGSGGGETGNIGSGGGDESSVTGNKPGGGTAPMNAMSITVKTSQAHLMEVAFG